jgi:hypothetical protein
MGVDKFFKNFKSPYQKSTGQKYRKGQLERNELLARLASGFVLLLAKAEF